MGLRPLPFSLQQPVHLQVVPTQPEPAAVPSSGLSQPLSNMTPGQSVSPERRPSPSTHPQLAQAFPFLLPYTAAPLCGGLRCGQQSPCVCSFELLLPCSESQLEDKTPTAASSSFVEVSLLAFPMGFHFLLQILHFPSSRLPLGFHVWTAALREALSLLRPLCHLRAYIYNAFHAFIKAN